MFHLLSEVTYRGQRYRVWAVSLLALSVNGLTETVCYDLMPHGSRSLQDLVQFVLPHQMTAYKEHTETTT
jgi:hypothetical protein